MKKIRILSIAFLLTSWYTSAIAQQTLSLDSCRVLALRNNKQLAVSRLKQDVAANTRKALRTKYLPKVDMLGGYELVSKEISLLNKDQKNNLNNLGTNTMANAGNNISSTLGEMVQKGLIGMEQAQSIGQVFSVLSPTIAEALNNAGSDLRKAFRTNNRNMFGATIMVRQPIYMGGAITAANSIADISEELAANSTSNTIQNTLYNIDNAYWMVISLHQKNKLAKSFLALVQKLDSDVQKMINEGVATRADGLKVSVKVNEAEMKVMQAEDGLALSKMLLCQLCGLPIESDIKLADEDKDVFPIAGTNTNSDIHTAWENRNELKMLQNTMDISKENTKLIRAAYLPQVAVTGGYLVTSPSLYNGFEHKLSGLWNIGIMVRVPIWSWQEGAFKVRASKTATQIANMEIEKAREMIELQVNQSRFKVKEANKKLTMASKNVEKAEENLRCANLGFAEGVMQTTDVMAAQTAWMDAQTQKIDAEIDVRLSQIGLQKALGIVN
ncbi:MAG: TolC family protein [Prevotella sp.]|nr:TolC family protein [Prevotella sp.]